MFGRATKIRLGLFLLIAVVGIGFTGARYAGLDLSLIHISEPTRPY